jgi:Salmonella virulence plasmid 65kDa B protein
MSESSDIGEVKPSAAGGATPFTAPQLNLPRGGGALRGIDEKFAVRPVTGTGALTIPIATTPGRSGFGPQLFLSYDSGAGNGPFGFGWSLPLPTITRRTDKGLPRYDDARESDIFVLSGYEDLVPALEAGGDGAWREEFEKHHDGYSVKCYLPRTEGLFARIERWTSLEDGVSHWRTISRDNVLTLYGVDATSRIANPENPRQIYSWLICQSFDCRGNAVLYDYVAENDSGVCLGLWSFRSQDHDGSFPLVR